MTGMYEDLRIISHLLRGQRSDGDEAGALEAFYGPQADAYDRFRDRLLHGRSELVQRMPIPAGGSVVELGCGTGRNLDCLGQRVSGLGSAYLVDLCPSLLDRARNRFRGNGNVHVVEADASTWGPPAAVDAVFCCYSLSMIRRRPEALANALSMLKPGGVLGVVDFYVSEAQVPPGRVAHTPASRWFWRSWFAHDGVNVDNGLITALSGVTECMLLEERSAPLPYLPFLRAPYFLYVGRVPAAV